LAPTVQKIQWPNGKRFAFTIFDDTDYATVQNIALVYEFLKELGFRTTKSVWPLSGKVPGRCEGATCEGEPEYKEWLLSLKKSGFEIGFHNATFHSSKREQTIQGLDRFQEMFGSEPLTMANHTGCKEGIYWGNYRLSGLNQFAYNVLNGFLTFNAYRGHIEGDEFFWGDLCKERVRYVRNFVYEGLNTLKACPYMPYHDPRRPFVNYWFASSEGAEVHSFVKSLSTDNQDRLEDEEGACIMYTHLACGFVDSKTGRLHTEFRKKMERLALKGGWFVPVSTLLDYILDERGPHVLTDSERSKLERKWLLHKMRVGTT
jgi:hypothetical protein